MVPYTGIANMRRYCLQSVLLSQGFARDALISVSDQGIITGIDAAPAATRAVDAAPPVDATPAAEAAPAADQRTPSGTERIDGIVVPGMANAHSHAFQRAMAGNTEYRLSVRDSFWTWRRAMYALANRIEPDDLQILATQLFVEMLKSGYTSVAEFHYLHRQRDGVPYPGANALWDAVSNAAAGGGIGPPVLPTP